MKYLLILFILIPAGLFAQDRYIEIFTKDSTALKQYKINWHTGIDPVKTKAGTWVLPEKVIPLIPSGIRVADPADEKILVASDLREYLVSRKVVTLLKTDFIEPKLIEAEPIVKEIIKR